MKVKCEYCQSMVDSREKYCPSCGSPLPEVPETPPRAVPTAAKTPGVIFVIILFSMMGIFLLLSSVMRTSNHPSEHSASSAFAKIQADPTDLKSYQTVITYHLDQGKFTSAYHHAQAMLLANPGTEQGRWCVEIFQTFDQTDLAIQLALLSDALIGQAELLPTVADTPIERLMSASPLCQAMELFFGKTAEHITLADLQEITYLSMGSVDSLTDGRAISIGREPSGSSANAITLQVESSTSPNTFGLIFFQGLRQLEVLDHRVSPSELFLPNLTALTVSGIQLEDLTPLSALPNLEELSIHYSPLTSLEGLDALPALHTLTLVHTTLSDLSNLATQKNVTKLTLLDNDSLTSVASLAQMTQLTSLTLSGDTLSDLSPIAKLTALTDLTVTNTEIRNTAFLSTLSNLEHLSLYNNDNISVVPELKGLTKLISLRLESDESFASQSDMYALKQLKSLELLSRKDFSYLAPLAPQLEELTFCFTRTQVDLSSLSSFRNLRRLSFESEDSFYNTYEAIFTNLKALQGLPLEELDLGGNHTYESLTPVLSIPTLRSLDLSGFFAEGTDFTKFSNLTQLETLDLSGFRDMVDTPPGPGELYWDYKAGPASVFTSQLGRLTSLKHLNLAECKAEDISALSQLTHLTELNLANNNISDISALKNLTALTYLNLSGNPIADYSQVEGREGLVLVR